jgi:exopolysaccharide biosynthesis predicted pyruvyltransferase EpsI
LKKFQQFPSTANNAVFEDVVTFIGETDIILTDSYHAMYWAMILGKKVMVFPNSSKFYNFKYQPVISTFANFENDLIKVKSYSGVLEECRESNMKFSEKAFDYLGV